MIFYLTTTAGHFVFFNGLRIATGNTRKFTMETIRVCVETNSHHPVCASPRLVERNSSVYNTRV